MPNMIGMIGGVVDVLESGEAADCDGLGL